MQKIFKIIFHGLAGLRQLDLNLCRHSVMGHLLVVQSVQVAEVLDLGWCWSCCRIWLKSCFSPWLYAKNFENHFSWSSRSSSTRFEFMSSFSDGSSS